MTSSRSRQNCIIGRLEYEFANEFEDIDYDSYRSSFYIKHPCFANYFLRVSAVNYEEYCRIILYRMFNYNIEDEDDYEDEEDEYDEGEIIGTGIIIHNIISLHTYINWFLAITRPPLDLPRSLSIPEKDNNSNNSNDNSNDSNDSSNYNSIGESEEE